MNINQVNLKYGGADFGVLKRFMQEFFPFAEFRKLGFFTKDMRGDYYAQAKRVCEFYGYNSVFEYGAEAVQCHLSYNGERDTNEKEFISIVKNIYE